MSIETKSPRSVSEYMRPEAELQVIELPHIDERGRQVAEYDIRSSKDDSVGWVKVDYDRRKNEMSIESIVIDPGQQGRGYGKEAHEQLAQMSQELDATFVSGNNLTDGGRGVWESFVRDGQAVQRKDGTYEMLPFEQSSRE